MTRSAVQIKLSNPIKEILEKIARKRTAEGHYIERAKIILQAAQGQSNTQVARKLGIHRDTCSKWKKRFSEASVYLETVADTHPDALEQEVLCLLDDAPRSGRPAVYTAEQKQWIINAAVEKPSKYDHEATTWTPELLARSCAEHDVATMSPSTVWRILDQAEIKPWKSRYWLNSAEKREDPKSFWEKCQAICALYLKAMDIADQSGHLISVDEMTGVQAIERIWPDKPVRPGEPQLREFEYKRHGTLSLIAGFDVATGRVFPMHTGPTRTSADYLQGIEALIDTDPDAVWIFLHDNLNTHYAEDLVRMVARRCGITKELGKKGSKGILKNMKTRAEFLSDENHRIRFVYTPRHSSWLNQVEIWFSKLARGLLKRGNFSSVDDLKNSILRFITEHNVTAKPYKWTYTGVPLVA